MPMGNWRESPEITDRRYGGSVLAGWRMNKHTKIVFSLIP